MPLLWKSGSASEVHELVTIKMSVMAHEKSILSLVCHGSQSVKKDFKDIYLDSYVDVSVISEWFSQFGE